MVPRIRKFVQNHALAARATSTGLEFECDNQPERMIWSTKKLLPILGIESRVLCHPLDGMSSVRCLRCADAQGIKVKFSTMKSPRTVFHSVSTAKYQHVNTQQRIPPVLKSNRTVRQMQRSDASLFTQHVFHGS